MDNCTDLGIVLVSLGLIISLIVLILRACIIPRPIRTNRQRQCFKVLLSYSVFAVAVASIGFILLAKGPDEGHSNDTSILTILALLSVGIIAGFFEFSYRMTHTERLHRFLSNAVAICFNVLFYLLFGAVSYYIGRSTDVENFKTATFIIPTIMGIILLGNTFFDYWDYISYRQNESNE